MAHLNDFASRFRKGLANPFDSLGRVWCPRCQREVTCETAAAHQGTTYAYKQTCRRCGIVIQRGVYDNVPLVRGQQLPPHAVAWSTAPGEDRR